MIRSSCHGYGAMLNVAPIVAACSYIKAVITIYKQTLNLSIYPIIFLNEPYMFCIAHLSLKLAKYALSFNA